jgi:hypothetical protein
VWMSSMIKFPLRVALPFYFIAAFGMFIILAREIGAQPAESVAPMNARRAPWALLATGVALFVWVRSAIAYVDRPIVTQPPEVRAFFARVSKVRGFVLPSAGFSMDYDPLHPNPYGYSGLPTGWGTFTQLWYDYLAQFGLHHGGEILPWLIDNPNAYVFTTRGSHDFLEGWIKRQVRNPHIRFEMVDAAPIPDWGRPELGRLVTRPLIRDSEEWRIRERIESAAAAALPGPPSVDTLAFRPIALDAPYDRFKSRLRDLAERVAITSATRGNGLRVEAAPPASHAINDRSETSPEVVTSVGADDEADQVAATGRPRHVGLHIPVDGMAAARFELELIDPEHVVSVHVRAQGRSSRSIRWDWFRDAEVVPYAFNGRFTLVPGYSAHQLALSASALLPHEVTSVHIFVTVDPAGHAGFELRRLEVAPP